MAKNFIRNGFTVVLLISTVVTTAIVANYKGLIDIRIKHGASSGQMIIDGRTSTKPKQFLPESLNKSRDVEYRTERSEGGYAAKALDGEVNRYTLGLTQGL